MPWIVPTLHSYTELVIFNITIIGNRIPIEVSKQSWVHEYEDFSKIVIWIKSNIRNLGYLVTSLSSQKEEVWGGTWFLPEVQENRPRSENCFAWTSNLVLYLSALWEKHFAF